MGVHQSSLSNLLIIDYHIWGKKFKIIFSDTQNWFITIEMIEILIVWCWKLRREKQKRIKKNTDPLGRWFESRKFLNKIVVERINFSLIEKYSINDSREGKNQNSSKIVCWRLNDLNEWLISFSPRLHRWWDGEED